MAIQANLVADQGSTFTVNLEIVDQSGSSTDLLTGLPGFRGHIRKAYSSQTYVEFICTPGADGVLTLKLDALTTRAMKPGRYLYDIEMFDLIDVTRLIEGQIEITAATTQPTSGGYQPTGHGSPEGLLIAPLGYSYLDVDTNTLYFRSAGSAVANTGWQAYIVLGSAESATSTVPTSYQPSGSGSPEGIIAAPRGYSYIDVDTNTLYIKIAGDSTTSMGWQAFLSLTAPTSISTIVNYTPSGSGSPEGVVIASQGYSYVDVDTDELYFKITGTGTTGWQKFVDLTP